jgi:hypothetical protein
MATTFMQLDCLACAEFPPPAFPPHTPLHPLIVHNRNTRQISRCWRAVAHRTRTVSRLLRAQAHAERARSQRTRQSCQCVALGAGR